MKRFLYSIIIVSGLGVNFGSSPICFNHQWNIAIPACKGTACEGTACKCNNTATLANPVTLDVTKSTLDVLATIKFKLALNAKGGKDLAPDPQRQPIETVGSTSCPDCGHEVFKHFSLFKQ